MNELTFESSWGEIITNLEGIVIRVIGDKEIDGEANFLHDIKKVDVAEYEKFLADLGHDPKGWEHGDILSVGYWTKDDTYSEASKKWRDEMFYKMNCPVCNSNDTSEDNDFPDTMRNCDKCGSDWIKLGAEILLDARDYFTIDENKALGRNPKT